MTAECVASSAPRKALVEGLAIDEAAGVAALADAPLAVKRLDLETDHPALHRDHPRGGPHHRADRRGREMADVDLGADRDPARREMRLDGVGGRHLHFHDHHRRRIDHRHAGDKMPDGALGRHHQRALGAHADLDDVTCIHGNSCCPSPLAGEGGFANATPHLARTSHSRCKASAAFFKNGAPRPPMATFSHRGRREEAPRYLFCIALRSTKVLPPFILWASGASLIWITTASASTPRFFTSACVMSRIMPAFCSSVRPAAMLMVISGIVCHSLCFCYHTIPCQLRSC